MMMFAKELSHRKAHQIMAIYYDYLLEEPIQSCDIKKPRSGLRCHIPSIKSASERTGIFQRKVRRWPL